MVGDSPDSIGDGKDAAAPSADADGGDGSGYFVRTEDDYKKSKTAGVIKKVTRKLRLPAPDVIRPDEPETPPEIRNDTPFGTAASGPAGPQMTVGERDESAPNFAMITDPARERSPDTAMIEANGGGASAKSHLAPSDAPENGNAVTSPGGPVRPAAPPAVVVENFVSDFAAEIDRLGIDMSVKLREGMKVEFLTPNQDLIVTFETRELPFDKIAVKQNSAGVAAPGDRGAGKRAEPQSSEFLSALTNLLGCKSGKSPAQDCGVHGFAWNGSRLTQAAPGGKDRIVLTAELFEINTKISWRIELADSRQAAGKPDAGRELSPAGIRRLLAPLLAGLGPAMQGGGSAR